MMDDIDEVLQKMLNDTEDDKVSSLKDEGKPILSITISAHGAEDKPEEKGEDENDGGYADLMKALAPSDEESASQE